MRGARVEADAGIFESVEPGEEVVVWRRHGAGA